MKKLEVSKIIIFTKEQKIEFIPYGIVLYTLKHYFGKFFSV